MFAGACVLPAHPHSSASLASSMTAFTILVCGGGSLGHVTPALAVAEALQKREARCGIEFVCSERRNERLAIEACGFPVRSLSVPHLPSGITFQWLVFPFSFALSCLSALRIIRAVHPNSIFSKGGAVSVPVCLMASALGIPIILHESDSTMGRANRLIARIAIVTCLGLPIDETLHRARRVVVTGNPVRSIIARGSKDAGKRITGFSGRRPVFMILGGSQGSLALNQAVFTHIDALLEMADIIHLTGEGKQRTYQHAHYFSREAVGDDIAHLYALADIIVSRAGAGTLSEIASVRKPAVIVPLTGVARDHQRQNAELLAAMGGIVLLRQEELSRLPSVLSSLMQDPEKRQSLSAALAAAQKPDAAERIAQLLLDVQ